MNKTAGIKPISKLDDTFLGELKQAVLLFDLIGIPYLDKIIDNYNEKTHDEDCKQRHIVNELEYIKEKGLILNTLNSNSSTLKKGIDIISISKEFEQLSAIIKGTADFELALEAGARLSCLILNNEATERDFYSIPLIKRLRLPDKVGASKTEIINLVIEQMPVPNDKTPWENIIEFKNNPDNKGRFAGLRNWVNKSVKSGLTTPEIKDELDYLLYQYSKSLELHKIKHNSGILQTFVVGTAEIIENVAKLNFSDIAKGVFSATQSKVDLLNAELTSPGNELSYIYKARETFIY
ncbi:MAG: hypothetical protein JNL63_00445 [Bacteroidia bacterium]|nr:hypothetical protein [Bacteroidia bacterium]